MAKTAIGLVVDASGSMGGQERDVVGSVNNFIAENQKPELGEGTLTRVVFRGRSQDVCEGPTDVMDARKWTADDYHPFGSTALCDAVANAIGRLEAQAVWAERFIVCVVTDGGENNSAEWNQARLLARIKALEETGRWVFLYLGPDAQKWADGSLYQGTKVMSRNLNAAQNTASYAAGASMTASLRAAPDMAATARSFVAQEVSKTEADKAFGNPHYGHAPEPDKDAA